MKFYNKVLFLRKINSIYTLSSVKMLKNDNESIIYLKEKAFSIDYKQPVYFKIERKFSKREIFLYAFDVDSGQQLTFNQLNSIDENKLTPQRLKMLFRSNIMQKMSASLSDEVKKPNYTLAIVSFVLGALIGGMMIYIYLSSKGVSQIGI